jgi:hypothetical protein
MRSVKCGLRRLNSGSARSSTAEVKNGSELIQSSASASRRFRSMSGWHPAAPKGAVEIFAK